VEVKRHEVPKRDIRDILIAGGVKVKRKRTNSSVATAVAVGKQRIPPNSRIATAASMLTSALKPVAVFHSPIVLMASD